MFSTHRPTAFVVGRGVDLETAVAVKDLALRMGNAAVYKEGGIAGEDYPNHLKLTDVDEASEHTYSCLAMNEDCLSIF